MWSHGVKRVSPEQKYGRPTAICVHLYTALPCHQNACYLYAMLHIFVFLINYLIVIMR